MPLRLANLCRPVCPWKSFLSVPFSVSFCNWKKESILSIWGNHRVFIFCDANGFL